MRITNIGMCFLSTVESAPVRPDPLALNHMAEALAAAGRSYEQRAALYGS